jgi:hypothetical protein
MVLAMGAAFAQQGSPQSLPKISAAAEQSEPQRRVAGFRVRFRLTMGEDIGQHIGTLFEARGLGKHPYMCRAGASASAQTRAGFDGRTIEFSCGIDSKPASRVVTEDLGKPNPTTNRPEIRLVNGKLVEVISGNALSAGGWKLAEGMFPNAMLPVYWTQTVGPGVLYFSGARYAIMYDGKSILDIPGSWRNSLYYNGRIYLSWYDVQKEHGEILICRWKIGDEACVEERRLPWPYQRDLYGMLGWRGDVYLSSSDGQDGQGAAIWRVSASGIERFFPRTIAGQMSRGEYYGMTLLNDTLVAGHYRTGKIVVLAADGAPLSVLEHPRFPPTIGGGRPGDRELSEAQTLLIHGGKLWVGSFPWGLLWSASPDLSGWAYTRLLDTPPLDRSYGPLSDLIFRDMVKPEFAKHPKALADSRWMFASMWSQRVHNAAPWKDGIAFALTNMAGTLYDPERDRHAPREFYETYGKVVQIRAPATVSHTIKWPTSGSLDMIFQIKDSNMEIIVNGEEVAKRPLKGLPITSEVTDFLIDRIGDGLYGKSEIEIKPLH